MGGYRHYVRFPQGKKKVFTISYDDGNIADLKMIDIMNKYGILGTFNLNMSKFPEDITKYEGHEIACHGYEHKFWGIENAPDTMMDIIRDRFEMEKATGKIIRGMAYPYGVYDSWTLDLLKNSGLVYGRTIKSTHDFSVPSDWMQLHPTCHHNDKELMKLADKFINENVEKKCRMFYVWGHSYEFVKDNNFELFENLCKTIGGRSDIWYATNIQIFDYLNAYNRLIWSVDNTMVHNPTALTVYFSINFKDEYNIKPGETIRI
ncbi:MAG: polysaccharide deacetylase family protein [Clostridia bacterium]|nr:polysaccharide deacetylase family protein [Clostridia bacterium]